LEAERYYIADIIGNAISADLLSYILRDPEFTGIETKPGGWYRLFDYLEIIRDEIGRNRLAIRLTKSGEWRQDAFSTIIRILNVRYDLTEQVTYHHAKLSASAMLGKIIQLIGLEEGKELYEVGDEGFFKLLEDKILNIKKEKRESVTEGMIQGAEKLLKSLKCRRLHKRFHVISRERSPKGIDLSEKYSDPKERRKFEEKIERKLGLLPGSVIIFCPRKKATLKEAETLVIYEETKEDGSLKTEVSPLNSKETYEFLKREKGESTALKVENVAKQYIDLWKLYVFVDPEIIPVYGYELKKMLEDEFGPSTLFDLSFLELSYEYKLSKKISEKLTEKKVPELDKEIVLRRIPVIIEASRRDKKEVSLQWVEENLDYIIDDAIKGQRRLS
jgi:HD superfamily phosphohydrolase